jgi:hypothetical protein
MESCGRKFTVEMVPGDFTYADHESSKGYDGHPLLSVRQLRHKPAGVHSPIG